MPDLESLDMRRIGSLCKDICGVELPNPAELLRSIGIDSVSLVELVFAVEEELGYTVDEERFAAVATSDMTMADLLSVFAPMPGRA